MMKPSRMDVAPGNWDYINCGTVELPPPAFTREPLDPNRCPYCNRRCWPLLSARDESGQRYHRRCERTELRHMREWDDE